ncbi:hypothetical protein PV375_09070 [Gulosibacter sp. GYB002]|uniref:hypothetical protein n=1 Tax=Gulosibacter sp. GYB002 TaxID=2994391 RepID=UPI002F969800
MTSITRSRQGDAPQLGEVIAGWRLVRRLADDAAGRAQFAVVGERGDAAAVASTHWGGFAAVDPATISYLERCAVVVPEADSAGLLAECAIRSRLEADFVPRAEEVPATEHWRIAIYPLHYLTSFAEYVAHGVELEAGSIVTMLVPIAETIAVAHRSGVAHGELSLRCCSIDEAGRPQLGDWHAATELAKLSNLRRDLQLGSDLRALGQIADALLAQCSSPATAALRQSIDQLRSGVADDQAAAALLDALFRWAPAAAVPPLTSTQPHSEPSALRTQLSGLQHAFEAGSDDDEPLLATAPRRRYAVLEPTIERCRRLAAPIRPAIWLGVAAIGAVTVAAGVVLQAAGASADAEPADQRAQVVTEREASGQEMSADESSSSAVQATDSNAVAADDSTDAAGDSGAVVEELVQRRNACLEAGDAECLNTLYAASAPGLEIDVEAIGAGDSQARIITATQWHKSTDLGDVELYRSSDGRVAVAVMRDVERGWLLREVWLHSE